MADEDKYIGSGTSSGDLPPEEKLLQAIFGPKLASADEDDGSTVDNSGAKLLEFLFTGDNVLVDETPELPEGVTLHKDRRLGLHYDPEGVSITAYLAANPPGDSPYTVLSAVVHGLFIQDRVHQSKARETGSRMLEEGPDKLVSFIYEGTSIAEVSSLIDFALAHVQRPEEQPAEGTFSPEEIVNAALGRVYAHRAGIINLYEMAGVGKGHPIEDPTYGLGELMGVPTD